MTVTIWHNPACGTSRSTLAMIRASGEEPVVIEYLTNPLGRECLRELIAAAGLSVREAIRQKGTLYAEQGLGDLSLTDHQRLDVMMAHPILIDRPFVKVPTDARLCRPSEAVLEILENPVTELTKEDG
jgi:arsenate reductase